MKRIQYQFTNSKTTFYFDTPFSHLKELVDQKHAVIVTDENIFRHHEKKFKGWNTIILKAGEQYKVQATVDTAMEQLIALGADRKTVLIGIGGGVITDITGYAGAIYMRGIKVGFIPTTILAMVDASIGGKNGIDIGVYKNLAGTIRQPDFLLYDYSFLKTLPDSEWINGFAEIIKHAAIKDAAMFRLLEAKKLDYFRKNKSALAALIEKNARIKTSVVKHDEFEAGERKLLNFGHTLGHAIENMYELSHGQAISIGMTRAALISQNIIGFKDAPRLIETLGKYELPTLAEYDKKKAFEILKMDKKKEKAEMNYILLQRIGKGVIQKIAMSDLEKLL